MMKLLDPRLLINSRLETTTSIMKHSKSTSRLGTTSKKVKYNREDEDLISSIFNIQDDNIQSERKTVIPV